MMNYIRKVLFLSFLVLSVSKASAQDEPIWQFGVKGGFNLSSAVAKDIGTKKIKAGYQVGLSVDYAVTESFYLQSGPYFSVKGIRLKGSSNYSEDMSSWKQHFTMKYIEVPLLAAYKMETVSDMKLVFNAGPYFAYGLGGSTSLIEKSEDGVDRADTFGDNRMKKIDYGLRYGAALEFEKLIFEISFNFGFANIANKNNELNKLLNSTHYRNKSFSLLMGYKF